MKKTITLLLILIFAFSLYSCDAQSNSIKIEETTSAVHWENKLKNDVIPMMSTYMNDWYQKVSMFGDQPNITISNIQKTGENQWQVSGTSTMNEKSGLTIVQNFTVVADYDTNQNNFSYSNFNLDDIKIYK